jgi:hypothetical protein
VRKLLLSRLRWALPLFAGLQSSELRASLLALASEKK